MQNDMWLGRYYAVPSKIHFMHPLSKIICFFLFLFITIISVNVLLNLMLLLFLIFVMIITGVPLSFYYRTVKSLCLPIFLIFFIPLLFALPINLSIVMVFRFILVVLYVTILSLTTSPTELTYGITCFLAPLRLFHIPVNKIALSMTMTLRFIPIMIDQAHQILRTLASRGMDYHQGKIRQKFKVIGALVIPIFQLTVQNIEQLNDMMSIRLYDNQSKRTNFRVNRWNFFDTYFILLHLFIFILFIWKGF